MPKYTIAIIVSAVLALAASPVPTVSEIKSPAPPGSGQPNLTVAADGRVFLSWIEPDTPQGYVLRFSVRGAQGWSAPKTIARGANWVVRDADVPSLAVLSDGTLAADWFVASVGARSEAYDVNLVVSKDGGTIWTKPLMPHREGKKRQHGFVSLVATSDAKLGASWLADSNMPTVREADIDP